MRKVCPKDCENRSPTCHSECERYKEFLERNKIAKEAKQKDWVVDNEFYNFTRDSVDKYKRKRGLKK